MMNEKIDYEELGRNIALTMAKQGHIKQAVSQIMPPMLEKHRKETIEEIKQMALSIGIDCSDTTQNQRDFAHLRTSRERDENIVNQVKDWSFKASVLALMAWLGFDSFAG